MKRKVIDYYKQKLNNWNMEEGSDWFDEVRRIVFDCRDGIADKEAIAVLATGSIIEDFHGWSFQLPSTEEALNYKGPAKINFYEWKEDRENYDDPVTWIISEEAPAVAVRFLRECSVWISGQV